MTGPLVPFREIVLKVHSRCDLACDHCYVYEHADQSWRARPKASLTKPFPGQLCDWPSMPRACPALRVSDPARRGAAARGARPARRVCEELTAALGPSPRSICGSTPTASSSPPVSRPLRRVRRQGGHLPRRRPRAPTTATAASRTGAPATPGPRRRGAAPRGALPPPLPRSAVHGRRGQRPGRRVRRARRARPAPHRLPPAPRHLGRPAGPPRRIAHRLRRLAARGLRPLGRGGRQVPVPALRVGALHPRAAGPASPSPWGWPPPTSSSSRPTAPWNRSTRSRAPTTARPPPASTSSARLRRGGRPPRGPGPAAGPGRGERHLPPVPGRPLLRRRPLHPPLQLAERLRQHLRVLRRPRGPHPRHRAPAGAGAVSRPRSPNRAR